MGRPVGSLAVALLVILGGCAGIGATTTTATTTATTVPTTETTTTTTTTTATTATTTVGSPTTTTVPGARIVTYETLSATEQRFFRDLLENESQVAPPPFGVRNLTADPDVGAEGPVSVRYRGALYEVSYRSAGYYGRYTPYVGAINASDVDRQVSSYRNLSMRGRSIFRTALAGDTPQRGYAADEFPDELGGYVRYDGTVYRVEVAVADYIQTEYSVEKVREE